MIIEFKDCGQDFLIWEIDSDGKIIDCKPFQASIWCGKYVFEPQKLSINGRVHICDTMPDLSNEEQEFTTIKYAIENLIKNG